MTALNTLLESLSAEQIQAFYLQLAQTVLGQYSMEDCKVEFIQHNSGITYHVESFSGKPGFLLKIHEPVGIGPKPSYERIQAQMGWLEKLSQASNLVIQAPIRNNHDALVTRMQVPEINDTVLCTMQRWVEGHHMDGDFTLQQVESVGRMIAQLHTVSSQYDLSTTIELEKEGVIDLQKEVNQLHTIVDANVISETQFKAIENAGLKIEQIIGLLGGGSDVYGPIHGDLHQENLLFADGNVYPIDFDSLRNSYYLLDLGTTLYHVFYQGVEFRRMLLKGYSSVRDLSAEQRSYLDAFVTWSAIGNLAFQATIPRQVLSKFFVRNMHQLTDEFCTKVVAEEPFALI